MVTVCGRVFSSADLDVVRSIIERDPKPCRTAIARETCELLGWRTVHGRLKEMSCRVALIRLEARGWLRLPAPLKRNGNRTGYRVVETLVVPPAPLAESAVRMKDVGVRPVMSREDSRLWNEAVSRFHYLGFRPLPGAQIRYLVERGSDLLGVVGFGAAAWKVAPRDRWIGWSHEQRRKNLHRIVNNARFLILPWVRRKNLASFVLARCAERIGDDFEARYGYRPVLLETFVERERFKGTCYRAANWTLVGETQGRGKLDRKMLFALPVKRIYVYPLVSHFRQVLCG